MRIWDDAQRRYVDVRELNTKLSYWNGAFWSDTTDQTAPGTRSMIDYLTSFVDSQGNINAVINKNITQRHAWQLGDTTTFLKRHTTKRIVKQHVLLESFEPHYHLRKKVTQKLVRPVYVFPEAHFVCRASRNIKNEVTQKIVRANYVFPETAHEGRASKTVKQNLKRAVFVYPE